jgi:hypothetical protein
MDATQYLGCVVSFSERWYLILLTTFSFICFYSIVGPSHALLYVCDRFILMAVVPVSLIIFIFSYYIRNIICCCSCLCPTKLDANQQGVLAANLSPCTNNWHSNANAVI